jgi:hypothetical protein
MNDVNMVDGLHLFLIMCGVVMMILGSTFAIHQMCMWGVRFFPKWNWWLYGSVRESQMQHFHFADNDFMCCVILLYELLNGLCQVYLLTKLLFSLQSNRGVLYFFFRTYISLYQILSCTVVKALLFWMKLYLCAELNKSLNMLISQSFFVLKTKKTNKSILYSSAGKLETSFTEFINYGIRGHLKPRAASWS